MSTSPASSGSPLRRLARYLPSGRAWWLVAGAFAAGLLLFALVLSGKRDEFSFYRAQRDGAASVEGQAFEPLPEPLAASGESASGLDETAQPADAPRVAAPDAPVAGLPPPSPGAPSTPAAAPDLPGAAQDASIPRPLSAPAPDYPRAALRSGASGDVLLLIEVDAAGRPGKVEVLESSRNRDLDRAAVQAVRRWRFQPAARDGVAVPATVRQSFRFDVPR